LLKVRYGSVDAIVRYENEFRARDAHSDSNMRPPGGCQSKITGTRWAEQKVGRAEGGPKQNGVVQNGVVRLGPRRRTAGVVWTQPGLRLRAQHAAGRK